jgi:acyl-CoA synthetase (AMP-forming)/AMP-acid ligase II
MNAIETVFERIGTFSSKPALYWNRTFVSYGDWRAMIGEWETRFADLGIGPGCVCGVFGDYSPGTCSLMFALMRSRAVIVPFSRTVEPEMNGMMGIAGVEHLFRFAADDQWTCERVSESPRHELIGKLQERGVPGLIVFTSGSTGKPKAILHDCERVMRKFVKPRPAWRTILFLMIDHFGGFNTLLATFANGGVGACPQSRAPEAVCQAIEGAGAALLPVTPTFLNLLIVSDSWRRMDLSSLELITYGTEVMPEATLGAIREIFPNVSFKQTYGLSEVGVLRSRSDQEDTTWVTVGGEGFETKVIDGILWIRSEANMVGYLNAETPFDEEGWLCTGDHVELSGDRMRFMGRASEIINVGGQKVFPLEVENVLLQADNVREATVYGVTHPLLGQAVAARISTENPEDPEHLKPRLKAFCAERLTKFKIPLRFVVVDDAAQRSDRFKKKRVFQGEES